ncbi:transcriptional regulator with XRE-family HTH domain [Actimicrobium sp. GrIS 1.19]|uniref:helix-turn-helix domain-containing protein n=1 Tax=Actimicrobium sp. GrIS 1.19 TaxID=3071708 RepID=UPI002E06C67E|nr:transcriptional regulator with XRE-family HTH domain [Actimicrobium sp. GrIS 1.19]
MTTLQNIGDKLRLQRKALAVTQADLAARSKVHRNTLGSLESGHGNVELTTLLAICEELGLDLVLVPKPVAGLVGHTGPLLRSSKSLKRERLLGGVKVAR